MNSIQFSSCELRKPGHVAQEAACFFGERRPLWLPPLVKSATRVAAQLQGSTSTSLAGDEWCKNRLWRDGGGVSSSVSLFHKLCVLCWHFFEMRIAGVLTALVVYSLHSWNSISQETTKNLKVWHILHTFSGSLLNWGMAFPRFVSTTKLDCRHYAMQHWEDIRRCWKRYWASAQIPMRLCKNLALAQRWWKVSLLWPFVFNLGTMRPCEFS